MIRIYTVYASYQGRARVKHIFADKDSYLEFVSCLKKDKDFTLSFDATEQYHQELYFDLKSQNPFVVIHTDGMVHVGEIITNGVTCSREQVYTIPKFAVRAKKSVEGISKARVEGANRLYDSSPWL